MQLVAILSMYNVLLPQNSKKLIDFIHTMVTFDMIYDIYDPTSAIEFSETPAFNQNFCEVALCSLGFYDALGSVAVIIVLTILTWLTVPPIRYLAGKCGCDKLTCCRKVKNREGVWAQDRYSVSNELLRIFLENIIGFQIAGSLAIFAPAAIQDIYGEENIYDRVNYWSGMIFLGLTLIFLVLICYVIAFEFKLESKKEEVEDANKSKLDLIE